MMKGRRETTLPQNGAKEKIALPLTKPRRAAKLRKSGEGKPRCETKTARKKKIASPLTTRRKVDKLKGRGRKPRQKWEGEKINLPALTTTRPAVRLERKGEAEATPTLFEKLHNRMIDRMNKKSSDL